jgi:TIR domain
MTADSRREVRFFVSYAQKNQSLANNFRQKFDDQIEPSKSYKFTLWQDIEILPGQDWRGGIEKALRECDLGLLLITPSFLSSRFVRDVELPVFLGVDEGGGGATSKPFIPVLLSEINLDLHDLGGLEKSQIYSYPTKSGRKSFNRCNGSQRDAFVERLHALIEKRLDRMFRG